jgi:hypothetical protein
MTANGILVQSTAMPESFLNEKEWFSKMGISKMAVPDVNPLLKRYRELTQRNIEREKFLNPHVCDVNNLTKVLKAKGII